MSIQKELAGIFAPLTTPFREEEPQYDLFRDNIIRYGSCKLAGYVILGSSGEAAYLDENESLRLVENAVEVSGKRLIIAGTARESTRLTIQFTIRAAEVGARAALVRSPAYYKNMMTPENIKNHYLTVAEASPIPVLLYNIPAYTGLILPMQTVAELSFHPNIIGIKDSSGDMAYFEELSQKVAEDFVLLTGNGNKFLPCLTKGAHGAILVLADVTPDLCYEIYSLYRNGRHTEAERLQHELYSLNKAITETYGIAAAKFAMEIRGLHGGECRSPLPPLKDEGKRIIRALLEELSLGELCA